MTQVKETGKEILTRVKLDPTDLSQAWLPTPNGMVRVTHSVRDKAINSNLTLEEWVLYCEEQAVLNDLKAEGREQHRADFIMRQEATTSLAKEEVNSALAALQKKPSRAALVSNLERNRRQEIELLRIQDREPVSVPVQAAEAARSSMDLEALPDAADDAMAAFWRSNK